MSSLFGTALRNAGGLLLIGISFFAFLGGVASGNRILAAGAALVGCGFLLAGAIVLGPTLASWFSAPWVRLYFPGPDRNAKPPPRYSLAEAKVQRDDYEGALADYVKITLAYPEEVRPYFEMIDIILRHLNDPERAEVVYRKGMETLKSQEAREVLARHYRASRSRAAGRPAWGEVHTVPYREDRADGYRTAPDDREHVPNPLRTSKPR